MSRPLLACLALVGATLALPAQAARWLALGTRGQAKIEVDADSLTRPAEGRVRIWYRETPAKPRLTESGAFTYARLTVLAEFQCDKRQVAFVERRYSDSAGHELKSESAEAADSLPLVPESSAESVLAYACKPPAKPVVEAPPPPPPPEAKEAPKKKGKKGQEEPPPPPPPPPHWSYDSHSGPDKWGSLGAEYATCAKGERQAPIDIRRTIRGDLPPLRFGYVPTVPTLVDNGHTIRVDTPAAGAVEIDGESYELRQFHFHRPSEEKVKGQPYAMDVHLVHQSKAGKLAVVAVLVEAGKEQPLLRTLWSNLPLERDKPFTRAGLKIDVGQILPAKRGYYTFMGSLTTPPCTEDVLWVVLKTPIQASAEQIAGFATLYRNNARPVQPTHNRAIKESR